MSNSSSSTAAAEPRKAALTGYVGFDTITSQIQKKLVKRGFAFNIMVVGRSGLGKSTLINTLFASHMVEPKVPSGQTTEIVNTSSLIEENGVSLKLTITDTPVSSLFVLISLFLYSLICFVCLNNFASCYFPTPFLLAGLR